jgi:2-(1,2-epoxy-1,2-dihydrophenyl)acetyl-CoA isomerase
MPVGVELQQGIGVVTLDRPDVRNAINIETLTEIAAAFERLERDRASAVVLCGANGVFCAGADLALVKDSISSGSHDLLARMVDTLHDLLRRMQTFPHPIVAALEGPAVGAGAGLAFACDLRVASKSARLIPGYFGIGSSPDGGVSYYLARAFGSARALSMFIRNHPLSSDELLAAGLVESVVDDGAAIDAALQLAANVSSAPPLALVRTRSLVDSATASSLSAQLDAERAGVAAMWPTKDFKEGVVAFLERRRPEFTGE